MIKQILQSKRNNWIKLMSLDWIYQFSLLIDKQAFFALNNPLVDNKDELIRIQSLLNLLLLDAKDEYWQKMLSYVITATDTSVYYRIANCICYNDKYIVPRNFAKYLVTLVKDSHVLKSAQIIDLVKEFKILPLS